MKLQRARGTRDLMPEDAIVLREAVDVLARNFALFGFNPIQTPLLERSDVLASKYTGGSEILKEMFTLKDQGKRDLALRYDLTVPFSRFVAMNPQLKLPFKRFQIGRVFRDGPIKASRYREFSQCDCDVVGTKSIAADAECVELFLKAYKELGLDVVVRVNNRKILDEAMDVLKIKEKDRQGVILAIDKLDKKGKKEVVDEIASLGIPKKSINGLFKVFDVKGSNSAKLKEVEKIVGKDSEGLKEIKTLLQLCPYKNVVFLPSLARGLAYYTGTIFEIYLKDESIKSSIGSGGRYDKMIGDLMGSKVPFPAVGCSFGLDVIVDALKAKRKKVKKSVVDVYVVPVGLEVKDVWPIIKELRENGVSCDLSFKAKGVTKALKFANAYDMPYVVIVGENELKKKKVTLKDMNKGSEKLVSLKQVVKEIKT
tara:strand:+ start:1186 stop:2463 length:1278 start_codon:yes stop_codon:yes gene_type:complete